MIIQTNYPDLHRAIQGSKLRAVGYQDVNDAAHARVMAALLRAYGDDPQGFIYAEPSLASTDTAPDLVLAHPAVGVIVFEVKAYDLEFIQGMEAGSLKIRRNGNDYLVNPLKQAQRGMYAIKERFDQLALDGGRPLFNAMVALPNIREADWIAAGYEVCIQRRLVLFSEDSRDPERLRTRIQRHVHHTLSLSGLGEPLAATTEATLQRVFGQPTLLNQQPARSVRALQVDNLGAEIDHLEAAHKVLSTEQQELARLDTWGHPYLLRGVAGSGKSMVLAYHVAYVLMRNQRKMAQLPLFDEARHIMPKIAVVCLHRTLVPLLQHYIEAAYASITDLPFPPNALTVHHLNGLIFDLAEQHDHFHYIPMTKAKDTGERSREYLAQLDSMTPQELDELRFDAMYIDEGQDIHPDTLALLYTLVRPNERTTERTISIYYDDAQNIYGHPRPTWRTLGINVEGGRASFMRQCYRNASEIITLGLNVLLGSAADEKTRVKTRRFADIYTLSEKGLTEETPDGWRVLFAQASGQTPLVKVFPNRSEQVEWLAAALVNLIEEEQVRPEDVLVLADRTSSFPHLEQRLAALTEGRITPRLVGGKNRATLDDPLLIPGQLTFATVYVAKGYDVPIVFLIDADQIETSVTGRALFYVGVTRAKRYLMVTGVKTPDSLLSEAQVIHKRFF